MGTKLALKMVSNGYNSTNNRNVGILSIDLDSEFKMLKITFPKNSVKILPTMQCKFETGNVHQIGIKNGFKWLYLNRKWEYMNFDNTFGFGVPNAKN